VNSLFLQMKRLIIYMKGTDYEEDIDIFSKWHITV